MQLQLALAGIIGSKSSPPFYHSIIPIIQKATGRFQKKMKASKTEKKKKLLLIQVTQGSAVALAAGVEAL